MAFTREETIKFNNIKQLTRTGLSRTVSNVDRQWVLDLMRREKVSANHQSVLDTATRAGFNVDGIKADAP